MIVIPMAGQSRRFYEAGFDRPKYELAVGRESLFAASTRSFEHYFSNERFLFVCRAHAGAETFVARECERLGIADSVIVALDSPTRGQAESVLLGLQAAHCRAGEPLLIFNIDTIRPGYVFPPAADWCDGYLEVFEGNGEHWSFVRPAAAFSCRVAETTEKKRISNLCCTGLYYFSRADDFDTVCAEALHDIAAYQMAWGNCI